MKRIIFFASIFVACLFATTSLQAATYTVDDDGPADFSTIQAAISAAVSGDIIHVFPGTYNENINMKDGVSLVGSGPELTIIDGGGSGSVVSCINIGDGTIISSFTITNGLTGIYCHSSSPLIQNNYITDIDLSSTAGNGIRLYDSCPKIEKNVIFKVGGMGISGQSNSEPQIINNTIFDYRYYAGISFAALNIGHVSPIIKNNIIYRGNDKPVGGILWKLPATPHISYNDVFDPANVTGTGSYYSYHDGTKWNEADGGPGALSVDPLFEDAFTGDFYLQPDSSCIDAGDPDPVYNDQNGSRNDMGAYGGQTLESGPHSHPGSGFIFTTIGKIPVSEIIQDQGDPSHGLANVSPTSASDFHIPQYKDSPLGGYLWIRGLFGAVDDVDYYQILVKKWENFSDPGTGEFVPLSDSLAKLLYTINPDGTVTSTRVVLGPKVIGGIYNLYELNKSGFWTFPDLRIIWNTTGLYGKYTLTYKAFRWDEIEQTVVEVDLDSNDQDHLTIVVDNTPVQAIIHNVKYDPSNPNYNPGADGEIPECGIINLTSNSENLRFTITAWHPNGYLKNYALHALYGKNRYGGVIKSESYDGTSPPYWHGVEEQEFQSEDAEPGALQPWERCAYQFRLRAWSRTTDGYHYIIWKEFNDHYYLDIGLHSLCKGDFDNDGDVDGSDLSVFASEFGRTDCLPTP